MNVIQFFNHDGLTSGNIAKRLQLDLRSLLPFYVYGYVEGHMTLDDFWWTDPLIKLTKSANFF